MGTTPERAPFAAGGGSEKRRMMIMSVGLVLLVCFFFYSSHKATEYRREEESGLTGPTPAPRVTVHVPEIDTAKIDELVSDASDEDRVLLERDALDEVLDDARNLTPAQFEAMGAEELDGERIDELLENPSAARGRAFTARGWVDTMRVRRPGGGRPPEVHGKLLLEDDSAVYFVLAAVPDGDHPVAEIDFARVDGLFLKAYNEEDPDEPGKWVQGPLLVAPDIRHSYRDLGEVTALPANTFHGVQDDDAQGGISGVPHDALWTLMAFARDHDHDSVDWESEPEIDTEVATDMLRDGDKWRGRPFRLPVTKVLAIWERAPGENPARMKTITEGWIASWLWKGEARVLRFSMPGGRGDIREGDEVYGTGYFLKNLAYEPENGGMRVASMVVMDTLHKHHRPVYRVINEMWMAVTIGLGVMTLLLIYLVTRDRQRSRALQQDLVRRRRARRALRESAKPADGASSAAPPA